MFLHEGKEPNRLTSEREKAENKGLGKLACTYNTDTDTGRWDKKTPQVDINQRETEHLLPSDHMMQLDVTLGKTAHKLHLKRKDIWIYC